jgi:transcriptional regulator with XRE-family HTH domain
VNENTLGHRAPVNYLAVGSHSACVDDGTSVVDLQTMQSSARIRALRLATGLSLQALAETCGLSAADLSEIEKGRLNLSEAMLAQIAESLGKPIEWFGGALVRHIKDTSMSEGVNQGRVDGASDAVLALYVEQFQMGPGSVTVPAPQAYSTRSGRGLTSRQSSAT